MKQMGSSMSTGPVPSVNPPAMPQPQSKLPFLRFPPEIRNAIYREALITSPNVVRSFVPPALLQTCQAIRQEGTAIYYHDNHFEITLKRAPEHQAIYTYYRMRNVDRFAWERFWTMWGVFGSSGANVLRHITRITLIYELSMDTGFGFGHDAYDKRIGFRFLNDTRAEDQDPTYEEPGFEEMDVDESGSDDGSDTDTESNDSEEYEYRELDADDIQDLKDELAGLAHEANNQFHMPRVFFPIYKLPAPDFDVLGVYELITAGNFAWASRAETYGLLYNKVNAYGSNNLWKVYPCQRFAEMLWRCGTDCPLAAQSVDFICDDYQHWMYGDRPYREFDSERLYNPNEEEDD